MSTVAATEPNASSSEPGYYADLAAQLLRSRRRKVRRSAALVWVGRVFVIAAFVSLWYVAGWLELIDPIFLSTPAEVLRSLADFARTSALWTAVWATSRAALSGLVLGSMLGVLCGWVLYSFPLLRRAVSPFITLANALPRPALAPIFVLWFGLGVASKVAVSLSVVFFVLLLNALAGFDSIDADHEFLARSLKMSRRQFFLTVQVPSAAPSILAGLRLAAVYSVLGVLVSELVASREGLGVLLVTETNRFNIAGSFAVLLVLGLLASLLDLLVLLLQRVLLGNRRR